jgi:hypothetical protein
MDKIKKRGRRRIRTAQYWREYYTRKQREWRAAHPQWRKHRKQKHAGLEAAFQRALKAKPPFIPARDGDEELARLAALCRELQHDAGDRAFICPVNVVQQFLHLPWPNQANWLLHVLENEGVIECVERGIPNKPGQKGKPTLWRYKLPMETV